MKTSIVSLIVIIAFAFTSCQNFEGTDSLNTSSDEVLKSAQIAVNDIAIESVVEDANYEAELFAEYEKILRQLSHLKGSRNLMRGDNQQQWAGDCPNVSIDTTETTYPVVITLDYGEGTELQNGRYISGTIIIEISAEKGTDGATRTISYVDCVIDSINVNGVTTQTFNGDNETTRTVTTASDVTFVLADGTVIDREGSHVRNWVSGISTREHDDDMIEITGSVNLSSSTESSWTRSIIDPLIRLGDCRHNVQGTVQISQNGVELSVIDFGDGECDNLATLTVNGETIEIELGSGMPRANLNDYNNRNNSKRGNGN